MPQNFPIYNNCSFSADFWQIGNGTGLALAQCFTGMWSPGAFDHYGKLFISVVSCVCSVLDWRVYEIVFSDWQHVGWTEYLDNNNLDKTCFFSISNQT